jgi:hypothetical protein
MDLSKQLPEAEQGDFNHVVNSLPTYWDMRTPFGQVLIEKLKDLAIDEANKLMEAKQ